MFGVKGHWVQGRVVMKGGRLPDDRYKSQKVTLIKVTNVWLEQVYFLLIERMRMEGKVSKIGGIWISNVYIFPLRKIEFYTILGIENFLDRLWIFFIFWHSCL